MDRFIGEYEHVIDDLSSRILNQSEPIQLNYSTLKLLTSRSPSTEIYSAETTSSVRRDGCWIDKVALKRVDVQANRLPCNPEREIDLLTKLSHPNILKLLNAHGVFHGSLTAYIIITPLHPLTLSELLSLSSFQPSSAAATSPNFSIVAHSLAWQMIRVVGYLHLSGVVHRDIGIENFVLSRSGRVILIDFGLAITDGDEQPGSMHFEVGTGHFRAPELLFGSRSYDASAIDLWALGVTLAQFFTPFISADAVSIDLPQRALDRQALCETEISEAEYASVGIEFMSGQRPNLRGGLFTSDLGDFALIGSIFRVIGTPTLETWPEAIDLPDFSRFTFDTFPPSNTSSHLPYLSPSSPLLSIIGSLLQCSASKRMSASKALAQTSWKNVMVLAPTDFHSNDDQNELEWNGQTLGDLIEIFLETNPSSVDRNEG